MNFAKRAEELSDQIIKDRRYLHQHPELSYKEKYYSIPGSQFKRAGDPGTDI